MHYLRQFHPDYNPEGIGALIAEAGAEDWVTLWKRMADPRENPDTPTMNAWVLRDWYNSDSDFIVMERNPFYWKIDTEFNQLPYIDRIQFTVYPSAEELRFAAKQDNIICRESDLPGSG